MKRKSGKQKMGHESYKWLKAEKLAALLIDKVALNKSKLKMRLNKSAQFYK